MSLRDCLVAPQFLSSMSFVILGAIFCLIVARFSIMFSRGSRVVPSSVALSVGTIWFPPIVITGFCLICGLNRISCVFLLFNLMNHLLHQASNVSICLCRLLCR